MLRKSTHSVNLSPFCKLSWCLEACSIATSPRTKPGDAQSKQVSSHGTHAHQEENGSQAFSWRLCVWAGSCPNSSLALHWHQIICLSVFLPLLCLFFIKHSLCKLLGETDDFSSVKLTVVQFFLMQLYAKIQFMNTLRVSRTVAQTRRLTCDMFSSTCNASAINFSQAAIND